MSTKKAKILGLTSSTLLCSAGAAWASLQAVPKELSSNEREQVDQIVADSLAFLPVVEELARSMDPYDSTVIEKLEQAAARLEAYRVDDRIYKFIIPAAELGAPSALIDRVRVSMADGAYERAIPRELDQDSGILMFNAYRPDGWSVVTAMHEIGHAIGTTHSEELETIRLDAVRSANDSTVSSEQRREKFKKLVAQTNQDHDLAQLFGHLYEPIKWAMLNSTVLKLMHSIPNYEVWAYKHYQQEPNLDLAKEQLRDFFPPKVLAQHLAHAFMASDREPLLVGHGITEDKLMVALEDNTFYDQWIERAQERNRESFELNYQRERFETEESSRKLEKLPERLKHEYPL